MFHKEQLPYTLAAAALMAVQPILISLSKDGGNFAYNVVLSTMITEALKLALSSALLARQRLAAADDFRMLADDKWYEFATFAAPGFVYFANNNLLFLILRHVNPATFQLLSQLKTIFTGLLFRACLGRKLHAVQYLALVALACGAATSQLRMDDSAQSTSLIGAGLAVVSCFLSALGGIYSEMLLKGRPSASIHWQNIQLYTWGILFNGIGAIIHDRRSLTADAGFLSAFTARAWAVVVCNALNGLAISAVLKYADNIARVYAHAIAMMVTMLISVPLFGQQITPQLVIAICLVGASTVQYNLPSRMLNYEEESIVDDDDESELLKDVGHDIETPAKGGDRVSLMGHR